MQNKRTILTYTGRLFDFWDPKPEMICIEDIAHSLALINRYNGHTHTPYSVADHCERMSYLSGDPLVNLLHDAAEAYIGDVPSPQKRRLVWKVGSTVVSFKEQERLILSVIGNALGVRGLLVKSTHPDVKKADLIMLATEVRDLMSPSNRYDWWTKDVTPIKEKITPLPWELAEDQFLARFEELTKEKSNE